LTEGVIRLHGNFTEDFNGATIQPGTPGARFEFVGVNPQTVTFSSPGVNNAFFKNVAFENDSPGGIILNSNMVITGQMITSGAVAPTIFGNGRTITTTGVNVGRMTLDNVVLTINGGTITRFDRVVFRNYSPAGAAFTINHTALDATFTGLKFQVVPTSGKYLVANDTNGGTPAHITLLNATPRDGSGFTTATGGFIVDWLSTLEAIDDDLETDEDEAVTLFPGQNDNNFTTNPLKIKEVTQGMHGMVSIDPGDTTVTYTPAPNFNGVDTFTYTIGDTISTSTATVHVVIHADSDKPEITVLPATLDMGGAVLGTTISDTLWIVNTGAESLHVTGIEDSPLFGVPDVTLTLAPGDTGKVAITFEPPDIGAVRDTLSISSSDPSTPVFDVIVQAIGQSVGDVNGDGVINVRDVVLLVNVILGRQTAPIPETQPFFRSNLFSDNKLDVLDVIAVIHRILGLVTRPVAGDAAVAEVTLGEEQNGEDGRLRIPVFVRNEGNLAGVQIGIRYPEKGIRFLGPEPGERLADMKMEYANREGRLTLLVYSLEGRVVRTGQSPLLYLPIEIDPEVENAEVRIEEAILAAGQGGAVAVRLSGTSRRVSAPPVVFAKQNRPNPFNPSTEISYDLPRRTHVRLIVYNILGQEVIRLVDGVQTVGRYRVAWDGIDGKGRNVSSGLYLYRIVTDTGFSATYRMTLLK